MKNIKYLLLIIIICLFAVMKVDATTLVRDESNNYGVNKKWKINDRNINNVKETPYVDVNDKIYDFADILTDEEEVYLKELIDKFIKNHKMELIIYTVDKYYSRDSQNETWATDFYDYNDFGINNQYYDGIVLYRNAYASDPYYDIYTFGEAQLHFTQSNYDSLLDRAYPLISSKDYLNGFESLIKSVNMYVGFKIPEEYEDAYIDSMGYIKYRFKPPFLVAFILALGVSIGSVSVYVKKNKMVKIATKADSYLDLSTIKYTKRDNIFINSRTTSYTVSSSSSSGGGGGGHSSSGSSGGGHSSGGGRHG